MMILMSYHGLEVEDYRKLRVLVTFCVNGYFKLFFDIKVKHNHTFGPQHVVSRLVYITYTGSVKSTDAKKANTRS